MSNVSIPRHARDRNLVRDEPRPGPYESPYDVVRGYEGGFGPPPEAPQGRVLFFAGRGHRDDDRR